MSCRGLDPADVVRDVLGMNFAVAPPKMVTVRQRHIHRDLRGIRLGHRDDTHSRERRQRRVLLESL